MTNWAVGKQSVREKSFCIFYKTNTVLVSAKPKYYIKMNFLKKGQFTADDPSLNCLTYYTCFQWRQKINGAHVLVDFSSLS